MLSVALVCSFDSIAHSRTPLIREKLTPCGTTTYEKSGAILRRLIFRKHFCIKHLHFTSPNTGSSSHVIVETLTTTAISIVWATGQLPYCTGVATVSCAVTLNF